MAEFYSAPCVAHKKNPTAAEGLHTEQLANLELQAVAERVQAYALARSADKLKQLHHALTTTRAHSNYSDWSPDDAEKVAEDVAVELAKLGCRVAGVARPKAKRQRPERPHAGDLATADTEDWRQTLLEQQDLFADLGRWPRRPYCSDDLEAGVHIRSLRQAIERAYVQANPPNLRVWALFDIDRAGAAGAWESAGLPPPAWTTVNRVNGHAHSAWGLTAPVLVDGLGARDAPMRYLCSIESYMREKLGADSGYSGLITKNPAHPLWQTLRGPRLTYSLQELADSLPGIEKHRPKKRPELVGLGRNVHLFDMLRGWSYKAIRTYWQGGLSGWNAWLSACNTKALEMNADMFGERLLDGREVWHLAKSVAKWTWRNLSAQGFSDWQAKAGAKGGVQSGRVRLAANEDKRASARLMRAAGKSIRVIAAELDVPVGTVHRWCV